MMARLRRSPHDTCDSTHASRLCRLARGGHSCRDCMDGWQTKRACPHCRCSSGPDHTCRDCKHSWQTRHRGHQRAGLHLQGLRGTAGRPGQDPPAWGVPAGSAPRRAAAGGTRRGHSPRCAPDQSGSATGTACGGSAADEQHAGGLSVVEWGPDLALGAGDACRWGQVHRGCRMPRAAPEGVLTCGCGQVSPPPPPPDPTRSDTRWAQGCTSALEGR